NQLGIPAAITRTTDETLNRDERVSRILNAFGNDPNVIVLSNHINAGGGEGAEVVYSLRNNDTLAKLILESIGEEGQKIRKYYQKRLPSDPSKDYYFIQRLTGNTQSLLLEYGFIDNSNDLKKLQNNLLKYGEAVVRAIAEYTNTPYVAPNGLETNIYVVQRGDTLYSIANKFNTTVNELKAANNLTSNLLNIGEKIIIPAKIVEINPDDYSKYTVEKGDSLYSIAKKYNTTVDELLKINQLSSTNLSIGQQLFVPKIESDSSITIEDYYTVKSGDSLYSIAKKFNTTVDDIIKANNLTSTILQIGEKLIIPGYTKIEEIEPIEPSTSSDIYIVQSGDSLYSIAKKYNTTVNELKSLNNLSSNLLMIGQELKVPTLSNDYNVTYYVQSGDSLYSIARKYNTTVNEIKKLNNLDNELLSIGQALLIP
ncbi:MAG: LysM peptidoglycan-binding domain-containing protein, partial [bacterium]|nr:LysM peptidoglycan-binding domain-containing protein [bacterium]